MAIQGGNSNKFQSPLGEVVKETYGPGAGVDLYQIMRFNPLSGKL